MASALASSAARLAAAAAVRDKSGAEAAGVWAAAATGTATGDSAVCIGADHAGMDRVSSGSARSGSKAGLDAALGCSVSAASWPRAASVGLAGMGWGTGSVAGGVAGGVEGAGEGEGAGAAGRATGAGAISGVGTGTGTGTGRSGAVDRSTTRISGAATRLSCQGQLNPGDPVPSPPTARLSSSAWATAETSSGTRIRRAGESAGSSRMVFSASSSITHHALRARVPILRLGCPTPGAPWCERCGVVPSSSPCAGSGAGMIKPFSFSQGPSRP